MGTASDEQVSAVALEVAEVAPVAGTPEPPPSPPRERSMGRQVMIYGVGELLSRLVSFLMIPLYMRYLTPGDYGVVGLADTALNLLAIVGGARLTAGIYRFYHKHDAARERNAVVSTSLLLVTVTYGILGLGVILAAAPASRLLFNTPVHAGSLRLAAITFIAGGVVAVPSAFLVATDRAAMWVGSSLVKLVAHASLNIVLLGVFGMGLRGYFLSGVIVHVAYAAILGAVQVRSTGLRFSRRAAADLLRFWWPMIFTQLAVFVVTYGDRPILQRVAGTDAVGIYTLAYGFGLLVVTVGFSPFARVWDSIRFRYAKLAEGAGRDAAFSRAFIDVNVMLVTTAVGILLFIGDFLRVGGRPAYYPAAALVPTLVVAYMLQCWTMMHEVGILVRERTGFTTLANSAGGAVALAAYLLLIPRYHAQGAAVATLLSMVARWVVTLAASQRLWPIRYQWAPLLRLIAAGSAAVVAGWLVPASVPAYGSIAIHMLLVGGYALAMWNLGVLAEPVRERVRALVRSPRSALSALLARGA